MAKVLGFEKEIPEGAVNLFVVVAVPLREFSKPIDYKFTVYPILADGDLLGYFTTTKPGVEAVMIVKMIAMDYKNE